MKKLSNLKYLSMLIVFLSAFFFSCNNEGLMDIPEDNLMLKNGEIEDVICELTAGQTMDAGNVIFSNDGVDLTVTYIASNGWTLSEVHLYVGTLEGLPTNKKAVQIGHFPYGEENLNGAVTWSVSIPLSELDAEDCIIAAHAVVYNETLQKEETAWGNCTYEPVIAVKTRFTNGYHYAMTDGISYIDEFKGGVPTTHWCDYLGYNYFESGDAYILQSKHYADAGEVLINVVGDNLEVTVNTDYEMIGSYVFFGSLEDLGALALMGDDCPNYGMFTYVDNITGGTTHSYIIPIPVMPNNPNNITFFEAFGSKRWGWFSNYTF